MKELLSESILEQLAKLFGDTGDGFTGTEIDRILKASNIENINPGITKWKRIYEALENNQKQYNSPNHILNFIKKCLDPVLYIGKEEVYKDRRNECNKILSFVGIEIGEDNEFRTIIKKKSLTELEQKAEKLYQKLEARNIHQDILKLCKPELLADNYFHAVFEGVKTIADKIRFKTGLSTDGTELIDKVFSTKAPYLLINNFSTHSEKSEHIGFSNLLKGIFGMFRNTTSHELKDKWEIKEQDALDLFPMLSYIHHRLDNAVRTGIV